MIFAVDAREQAHPGLDLFASQRERLAGLAETWLTAGASHYGLWIQGQLLAHWPLGAPLPDDSALVAPILVGGQVVGELRMNGLTGPVVHARLRIEAELVSELLHLECELNEVTAALIDAQDQLLALFDLTASTRNHLTVSDNLRTLARETARFVQAQYAVALLVELGRAPLIEHHPDPLMETATLIGLFQQVQARSGELVLNTADAAALLGEASGVHSLLFIVVRICDDATAGLALLNKVGGDFTSPDLKLVRAIAEQAGAQIEKVLLYQETLEQAKLQHEMELAARIQSALLPRRLPQVPGLDLYVHCRPASLVGGDFYDLVALPGRPFAFAVGDVSGKGVSAALLMAMTRTTIHSKASYLLQPTPQEVMRHSSRDLYDDLTEVSMFVTVFLGQYESDHRRLSYANAGHSPVIFCPAGGAARLLWADDPPMGVTPLEQPEGHELTLEEGDLLLVATDGFSEARNLAGGMFGYDRLLESVENLAKSGVSAREVAQTLLGTVDTFSAGCPQDDDQTLMVLRSVL